ncbi:SET domain-containing protein [Pleomassaria siparia CBS 279.74]|uniref:SET domain-containing protein n=1 Tax=Pleomassaria siparia CBS 279.74 TaxID=1314801 RepID=A0A6G1K2J1_9PLEO|nr:SET domain-containing protein [Pleomassaria siparia CBS 279.74]
MASDRDSIFYSQAWVSGRTTEQSITDHADPAETLLAWFSQNKGWLNPHVRVVFDDSRGFHVIASRPLNCPMVARCPLSLTLSYLCLDHSQDRVPHVTSPLQNCLGKLPDFVLNYLFLVEQGHLGKDSPWHPYISCLPTPKTMTTPIWFTDEDMECLKGTNLMQATKDRLQGLREQWVHAQAVMSESGVAMPSEFDFLQFRWAATIFTSRAFISDHILPDRPTFPILFPVIDILNHSVEAKVEWNFSPHQDFTLNLLGKVDEGVELLNNYAPKQNDELLMGYGFCIPDNPVEQFAIKMQVPPEIIQQVSGSVELDAELIPFGMPASSLHGDQTKEQHFLRTRGHPLGRYENTIPCFQGFPSYLVHTSFLVALYTRQLKLSDVKFPNPGARLFLATLKTLYQAVQNRCERLPLPLAPSPALASDKQKYATIYRNGQANIIHTMRRELKNVLESRRVHNQVSAEPAIVTTTEALFTLKAAFPDHYQNFKNALSLQWGIEVRNSVQYANDVAEADVEDLVWVLLLIVFATITLTSHKNTLPYTWLLDLFSAYPLPSSSSTRNENYLHIHKMLRKFAKQGDSTWTAVASLDALGLGIPRPTGDGELHTREKELPGYHGPIEDFREKLITWALMVVETERIELPDHENEWLMRQCLYMRAWREDGEDEAWVFEDVGLGKVE